MSVKIENLIKILRSKNRKLKKGTRITYNLQTLSPTTIEIIVSLNISGEHFLRLAKKIAKQHKIEFLREYDFNMSRWSEPAEVKPIYYISGINCERVDQFNEALNRILSAKDELYQVELAA